MQGQSSFQGLAKTGGVAFGGVFLVRPRSEATVNGSVGVEQQSGEGKVVVELEQREVERIGVDQADALELIEQGCERRIFVEHASIDARTGQTGHAAQDH